jgi:hypothetical protein
MPTHKATITKTREKNERGYQSDCVYAECCESGEESGPIWGHGEASVKRALATLRENCDAFHVDAEES